MLLQSFPLMIALRQSVYLVRHQLMQKCDALMASGCHPWSYNGLNMDHLPIHTSVQDISARRAMMKTQSSANTEQLEELRSDVRVLVPRVQAGGRIETHSLIWNPSSLGEMEDDLGIDALCALIDADPGGGSQSRGDDLFDPFAPKEVIGGASSSNARQVVARKSDAVATCETMEHLGHDLPEPALAVPPDIVPIPFNLQAAFHLKCEVDLKKLAFGLRHAEYNPRKHTSLTVRLFEPRATALVRRCGFVIVTGTHSEDSLKRSAKKVARLVQKCDHEEAKFAEFKMTGILCKVDLRFPMRLDELASKWRRHAVYEPETYCGCVFRTRHPKCTYLLTAGGFVIISGCRKMETVKEALRRIYPVCHEFQM